VSQIKSIEEFDQIHSDLLNILLPNNRNPLIDFTQYEQFDLIMKSLRRIIEKLVIDSFISSEKIDQLQFQVKNLSEETKSLQALVYEEEFKKLVFCISTPIKDRLCNEFRRNNIRIDPLDDDLLYAIYNKSSLTGISTTDMKTTMSIFKQVAGQVGLHEKELIKIILLQLERNVEEHEILKQPRANMPHKILSDPNKIRRNPWYRNPIGSCGTSENVGILQIR